MMNEWEARYKALAMGIDDPKLIEAAEKIVQTALTMAQSSVVPFPVVMNALLDSLNHVRYHGEPSEFIHIEIAGGGTALVRQNIKPKTLKALNEMMTKAGEMMQAPGRKPR